MLDVLEDLEWLRRLDVHLAVVEERAVADAGPVSVVEQARSTASGDDRLSDDVEVAVDEQPCAVRGGDGLGDDLVALTDDVDPSAGDGG